MTLASGSRLGAYDSVSPLGAGGMGEVHKARDTCRGRICNRALFDSFRWP
jgi:hypothetical protein